MSKKDYIDAVSEIKPSEKLKKNTIAKANQVCKTKKYNKIYPISSLMLMCAIVISFMMIPKKTIEPIENNIVAKQETTFEKVESFEKLYGILKNSKNNTEKITNSVDDFLDMNTKEESTIGTKDYSETNIQVDGVDEADIVKTDGKYIYYLANQQLNITNANEMKLESKVGFEEKGFYPREILINNNKVIIIGEIYIANENNDKKYENSKQYAVTYIYNVEDRKTPKLERTIELEGSYITSRMIGDNIYLVANNYIYSNLCKKYAIEELDEAEFKPTYVDTAVSQDTKCVEFENIYYIPDVEDASYLNIAAFNVNSNEEANIESYLGAGRKVYASQKSLYVINEKTKYMRILNEYDVKTEIYKFDLDGTTFKLVATGTVPGEVLNQFSMDEKDGYFRIATTDNSSLGSKENDENNLYVLNEKLEIVGKIEGLAPGERIYSVRFMENRAYVVTFVQTDPLFVIDLTDPENPKVLGELKIPGFSNYLHPYDENHIIGFGQSTKVVNYGYGDVVKTNGMKMALFDVTDPTNPKEMYSVNIGENGTYSELFYNHKALLFSKQKNLIAFPISITEKNYNVTFQGALVYGISLEKGFEQKAKITNCLEEVEKYYYTNKVQRIIYIEDVLYTISPDLIKATDLKTMKTIGTVEL